MTEFSIEALEKALTKKERGKKIAEKKQPKTKKVNPDKPLLVAVDKKGREIDPSAIKEGKVYGLKLND